MRNTGNEPAKRGGMGLGGYLALRDTPLQGYLPQCDLPP